MKGTKLGQIHTVFQTRLVQLASLAANFAATLTGTQRLWQIPAELATQDLLHVSGLHELAWDREPINKQYAQVMQTAAAPGTVGDVCSLKIQNDYNAVEERAFRARHASVVRCMVHAHGRRKGQGEAGIFTAVREMAENILKAGSV